MGIFKKNRTLLRGVMLALCLSLLAGLWGCEIPQPGFADYDVAGYIRALLDSSYLNDSTRLVQVFGTTEQSAANNHITTAENAAVRFCNEYGLSPDEAQLDRLKTIMDKALSGARYTVNTEVQTPNGYTVDVQVYPITTFYGRQQQFAQMLADTREEAKAKAQATPEPTEPPDEDDDWDDDWDDDDGWDDDPDAVAPAATPAPTPAPTPSPAEIERLYMEKVLAFCEGELSRLTYESQPVTVTLNIVQTKNGELQLDLNQIDIVDQTVLFFMAGK